MVECMRGGTRHNHQFTLYCVRCTVLVYCARKCGRIFRWQKYRYFVEEERVCDLCKSKAGDDVWYLLEE